VVLAFLLRLMSLIIASFMALPTLVLDLAFVQMEPFELHHIQWVCVGCGHRAFEFWGIGVGSDANFGFEYGYIRSHQAFLYLSGRE
jgi:hypothetical protein